MPGQPKQKKSIRRKVIFIICLSTLTVMAIGVSLGYFFGVAVLRDMVGDVHGKTAHLLADSVTKILDSEIIRIKNYAEDPLWRELALKSNSKYTKTYPARETPELPSLKDYCNNTAAAKLRALAKSDNNIARLSVLDKYGALAAASEPDNFSAPDDKMLKRFLAGAGSGIFVGDIYFDEAVRTWVITVAVPIIKEGGNIGIFKADIATRRFFSSLGDFRMDSTGHAFIADEKGKIIFHPGESETNVAFCSDKDYEKLLTSKGKYSILYEPQLHKKKMFVAFSEVAPPLLLENGLVWRVFIDQEAEEVFAPLGRILLWAVFMVTFLIIVMVPVGFIFSNVVVKPIQKLHGAAIQIRNGDWNYPIDIKTGDEIEQFADVFKEMVLTIKDNQEKLIAAKKELEKFSKTLEEKIEERTKELVSAKNEIDEYAKELEKALVIKSDFVSTASHELRTPLAAIKEALALILDLKAGEVSERQREFLNMAKSNVDRLDRIISDILDFQKIEQGKSALDMKPNDINEVVNNVDKTMISVAQAKGLSIITKLDETLPKINFDKDKITQVVTNLINNAIKFTEKGNIVAATSRADNAIVTSVSDTGIGIREEDIPKLFQAFMQVGTGLERKSGGTGLGLAISRNIIQMHKGKIWVESKYGQGSTFYFILPITERRR